MTHGGWPWLALVGLGAFHGINPAMGWLFAVALGLHRQSRAVVVASLAPIAVGHALAVALVTLAAVALGWLADPRAVRVTTGVVLLAWAAYHRLYGSRHRVRVGMRTGMAGLVLWSFLMATAHGAGLMLVPVLLPMLPAATAAHGSAHGPAGSPLAIGLAAVGVHTGAMLAVTGAVAVAIYEWVGLAFLRRGWINLDLLWTLALVATGLILLLPTIH
jgi:hypothetical protein